MSIGRPSEFTQQVVDGICERLADGRLAIPADLVARWEKQIMTPYEQLSEQEKDSDREQVQRVLPVLSRFFEKRL